MKKDKSKVGFWVLAVIYPLIAYFLYMTVAHAEIFQKFRVYQDPTRQNHVASQTEDHAADKTTGKMMDETGYGGSYYSNPGANPQSGALNDVQNQAPDAGAPAPTPI